MIKSSLNSRSLFLSIPIFLVNYLLILFSKYWNNGLSLYEINLTYFGNIGLLIPTITVIMGLLVLNFFYKEKSKLVKYTIFVISFIALSTAVTIVALHFLQVEIINEYILSYPAHKIILGALFISNFLLLIYANSIIWLRIIKENKIALIEGFFITLLISAFLVLFTLVYTTSYYDRDLNKNYDIGFVLGAAVWSNNQPSPIFKQRINKSYELYKNGIINKIHFSGSNAPGELTEAEAAYKYLLSLDETIPANKIIIETNTTTTSEQLKYLRDFIGKEEVKPTILIITDQFHLMRVLEMAKFYGVNAEGISSGYQLSVEKLLYYRLRDSIGLLIFWFFAI